MTPRESASNPEIGNGLNRFRSSQALSSRASTRVGSVSQMPEKTFAQALNDHVPSEFAASQAYLAAAIYYDDLTMPRMAAFFYRQAVEERNHAMMIIRYLLDIEEEAEIPGVAAPKNGFADLVEPVRLALEQETQGHRSVQRAGLDRP